MSTLIAGVSGGAAGVFGWSCERFILSVTDLSMALPLLFVLIALRAMLPLVVAPLASVFVTFLLLGLLGWPSSLRVVWAAARSIRNSDFLLLPRASGCGRMRMILRQVLPNLRAVLLAQFWVSIPVFILTEATLSMLGVGVMEPMPSCGNLCRCLAEFSPLSGNPCTRARLLGLILVVLC